MSEGVLLQQWLLGDVRLVAHKRVGDSACDARKQECLRHTS